MTDTSKRAHTDKSDDTEINALDIALALILPAALVLYFWDDVTWAAWTAVAAGSLGLVLLPFAFYHAVRHRKVSLWTCLGLTLFTFRFIIGAWAFLF